MSAIVKLFALLSALLVLGTSRIALAQDSEPDLVEVLDESAPAAPAPKKPAPAPSNDRLELRGFARATVTGGIGTQGPGPENVPPEERVGLDRGAATTQGYVDLRYARANRFAATVSGSLAYTASLTESASGTDLRSGRLEPVLREAYLGFFGERVDLRVGQQRIVWGASEAFTPNDVLNARDLRNRMQLDPEMIHLPTPSLRADFDLGLAVLGIVAQPFFVPDRMSIYGNNWSLVQPDAPRAQRRLFGMQAGEGVIDAARGALIETRTPSGFLEGGSIGASLRFHSPSLDASFYWHWGLDRTPYVYLDPRIATQLTTLPPGQLTGAALDAILEQERRARAEYGGPIVVQHYRRQHVGADATTTAGPFVFRADVAFDSATTFFSRETLNSVARPVMQGVLGAEYQTGSLKKALMVEAWYMRLLGPEIPIVPVLDQANNGPLLFAEENNVGFATVARWELFENIVVETRAFFGAHPVWYMVRPEIGWDSGSFTIRGGVLVLDGEEGSTGRWYGRNDSAYLTARYAF